MHGTIQNKGGGVALQPPHAPTPCGHASALQRRDAAKHLGFPPVVLAPPQLRVRQVVKINLGPPGLRQERRAGGSTRSWWAARGTPTHRALCGEPRASAASASTTARLSRAGGRAPAGTTRCPSTGVRPEHTRWPRPRTAPPAAHPARQGGSPAHARLVRRWCTIPPASWPRNSRLSTVQANLRGGAQRARRTTACGLPPPSPPAAR